MGRDGLGSEKERREDIGAGRRQGVVGGVIGEWRAVSWGRSEDGPEEMVMGMILILCFGRRRRGGC